jgi:hypothetical protein
MCIYIIQYIITLNWNVYMTTYITRYSYTMEVPSLLIVNTYIPF